MQERQSDSNYHQLTPSSLAKLLHLAAWLVPQMTVLQQAEHSGDNDMGIEGLQF